MAMGVEKADLNPSQRAILICILRAGEMVLAGLRLYVGLEKKPGSIHD